MYRIMFILHVYELTLKLRGGGGGDSGVTANGKTSKPEITVQSSVSTFETQQYETARCF